MSVNGAGCGSEKVKAKYSYIIIKLSPIGSIV